jgi:hypothetical protein
MPSSSIGIAEVVVVFGGADLPEAPVGILYSDCVVELLEAPGEA